MTSERGGQGRKPSDTQTINMHAHLEDSVITRSDCPIQHLSWMGKVPDSLPEEDGWKLNRANYYEEGWLATGNTGGIVGVTFTAAHSKTNIDTPPRTNFNLRGHRSEVVLVKWNEPYQKLATCDVTGVIFVWIKHEGRWSIELINDRSSQVTDFTWSHDGRMALICYRDGFVLVGSVAGQRYWSSMLNLDSCLITCGAWSHDDQKVLFGTTDGQLIIMSAGGVMLSQITIQETVEVVSMVWACEKFYLSEQDVNTTTTTTTTSLATSKSTNQLPLLAVSFRTGAIYLVSNYDDLCPKVIHTGLTGLKVEWSNDGEVLAVAGFIRLPNLECCNEIRFYNRQGNLRYRLPLPKQVKPVSHITWGHNDRRLFVALGCHIYTIWVTKNVASLQLMCQRCIQQRVKDEANVQRLPLPAKIQTGIQALFCPTIRGYIPHPLKLREFVCIPPSAGERLYCTMIRHGEECSGGHYTLYLEYLGGLIPLLKGKRASKLRPEFIIFDPKIKSANGKNDEDSVFVSSDSSDSEFESDADVAVEGCGSPRMQRSRKNRKCKDRYERRDSTAYAATRSIDELMYDDNLPECHRLVEVTSNIWGTKFKLHSLASFLPEDLGQVLYKTSLLHLQPRQMTVTIVEISPDLKPVERDPAYNPNHFSESEDEVIPCQPGDGDTGTDGPPYVTHFSENLIAISPEGPPCPYPIPALGSCQHLPDNKEKRSNEPFHEVTIVRSSSASIKTDQLAPLEIHSLDGSPPQRRTPSLKPRSSSPSCRGLLCVGDTSASQRAIDSDVNVCNLGGCKETTLVRSLSDKSPIYLSQQKVPGVSSVEQATGTGNAMNVMTSSSSVQPSVIGFEDTQSGSCTVDDSCFSGSESRTVSQQQLSLWASKACHELKYIDDDTEDPKDVTNNRDAVFCQLGELGAREIMSSMQLLHQLEQSQQASSLMTGCGDLGSLGSTGVLAQVHRLPAFEPQKKRVILSRTSDTKPRSRLRELSLSSLRANGRCMEVSRADRCKPRSNSIESCGRSRSSSPTPSRCPLSTGSLAQQPSSELRRGSFDLSRSSVANTIAVPSTQSASLPNSPVHKILTQSTKRSRSSRRHCLRSPLSRRRQKHGRAVDSSDEEVLLSNDDVMTSENYRNLETFQKAQLNKKLRKARSRSDAEASRGSPNTSPHTSPHRSPVLARKCHFVMHNKAPMWNENSQVYQLDFGGRVTQESAKNFQIEFRGKQVMQFGRIDSNAYTLDFQHPFSAIQAFAVALANVTQRLK